MEITQQQTKDAMKETFVRLMKMNSVGKIKWKSTMFDLVELVHMMWYDGFTIDEHGQLLNFSASINRFCQLDCTFPVQHICQS